MPGGGPGWLPEQIVVGKRRAGLLSAKEAGAEIVNECIPISGTLARHLLDHRALRGAETAQHDHGERRR